MRQNTVRQNTVPALPQPGRHTFMDCTLRDGSYSVDFHFDAQTVETVLTCVAAAGLEWVEVGHGLGIGGGAVAGTNLSDEQWGELATRFLPESCRWGMFVQPGLASVADVRRMADAGMSFARIGVDILAYEEAYEHVRQARELGLTVFVNLMKSHLVGLDEAVRIGLDIERACAPDGLYFVDSVGQFLPEQTARLFAEASRRLRTPLGFHGHNNLGLANANTLAATNHGAAIVDCTLAGLGRDAGNAVLEQLAAVLELQGGKRVYHTDALAHASEHCVSRLRTVATDRELQVLGALYGLHSKYFPAIDDAVEAHAVDRTRLMEAVKPHAYARDLTRTDIDAIAKALLPTA
ncbi:putative 4-hydroxy-2-ketovalerate aldolase [Streptomyces viridochromogenes]|uniref:Putative 4-hydroxy-2-ketovalerate aldolase n=1 Tax=Streptomyces viridochromogenes Tue57 TaxID=1160705 RepID=L8P2F7_STRVR|nr:putative 4-hydroxy-2-ketovalerate aldolase [Streptomyces viridochromogenes]ELS50333.1 putative 4-hydroxy-2-ketovalerate aldolase [Streptomyces viridochromogenes Tue57]